MLTTLYCMKFTITKELILILLYSFLSIKKYSIINNIRSKYDQYQKNFNIDQYDSIVCDRKIENCHRKLFVISDTKQVENIDGINCISSNVVNSDILNEK